MPGFTKNAIKESFIKLLNERPLSRITVKDIVADCKINRNSFYYHFRDIPSLIEEIITENTNEIISKYPTVESMEQCMDAAIQFALSNKRAALHIYNSVNRDILEHYLFEVCEYVVTTYVNTLLGEKKIKEDDKKIIIRFYKCECFGQIIEWLNNSMKDDLTAQVHRLYEIRKGMIDRIISKITED